MKAVLNAYRREETSAARTLGLLLNTWAEDDLPDHPPLPAEAIWSFATGSAPMDTLVFDTGPPNTGSRSNPASSQNGQSPMTSWRDRQFDRAIKREIG